MAQGPPHPSGSGAPIDAAIESLAAGRHGDPFSVLGPHRESHERRPVVVIRACQPAAREMHVVRPGQDATIMARRHRAGVFEAVFYDASEIFDYRLRITYFDGQSVELDDPYRYGAVLTDFDLHLFHEGTHHRAFEKLGAHRVTIGPATGFHFAVWAPSAARVSVAGDFNGWDPRVHPMRARTPSGIWEIFIPNLGAHQKYKFSIRTRTGAELLKSDPYGRRFEAPPATASITSDPLEHAWRDAEWMSTRRDKDRWRRRPMAIYEVHLGSWMRDEARGRVLTYAELAERLVPYVKEMGYTHIELLPVMEHPFTGSWGYQVIGFFAPTSRFGDPEAFQAFIDACHVAGIGVILDWVPGHFPKDAHGLARFDGTALYEHEDPKQGEHQDWGTLIFNYGRHEVRSFLLSNALYWLEQFHVDALRVDAVASMLYLDYSRNPGQWVPNAYGGRENLDAVEFLRQLNALVDAQAPDAFTIAEESTQWPGVTRPAHLGGLGFTYKWNMGWMHDMLQYLARDPLFRQWAHNHITFSMLYAYSERFILPLSHDEVVHGKGSLINKLPGDAWKQRATLRAFLGYMTGHPGKKLLFMSGELGQRREWNHDGSVDWDLADDPGHGGVQRFVRDLNAVYQREASLFELDDDPAGFQWIDCSDHQHSVVSFMRRAADHSDFTVFALNWTPSPRAAYRIGVPERGRYRELLNSDADVYGGSDLGNLGAVDTEPTPTHGHQWSLSLTLPPLSCLVLKIDREAVSSQPSAIGNLEAVSSRDHEAMSTKLSAVSHQPSAISKPATPEA